MRGIVVSKSKLPTIMTGGRKDYEVQLEGQKHSIAFALSPEVAEFERGERIEITFKKIGKEGGKNATQ